MSDPLLVSVREAGELLGIGRSLAYELVAVGRLETVHIGRRVLVPRSAVERFIEELRADPSAASRAVDDVP
jgi:excisionase family DNA binding protein